MRFGEVGVAHDPLPEFLKRPGAIVLPPVQQPQARVGLRIIRLQFQRFLIRCERLPGIALTLENNARVVVAGRKLRPLLNRFLKEPERIIELLLFQGSDTLNGEHFGLRQPHTKIA